LQCSETGYWLDVVPSDKNGASVMFVTNEGAFVTHLFSLAPGAARVDDVRALTSASNAIGTNGLGPCLRRLLPVHWLLLSSTSAKRGRFCKRNEQSNELALATRACLVEDALQVGSDGVNGDTKCWPGCHAVSMTGIIVKKNPSLAVVPASAEVRR